MKLLLDANNVPVLRNGAPVYQRENGQEIEFDGAKAFEKIGALTGENAATRKRADELDAKLKTFEGIEDPEFARKAIETVKNLDDGKLILANKVEEMKLAAQKAAQEQVAAASKAHAQELALTKAALEKKEAELNSHIIGGSFSRSKLIVDPSHPMRLNIQPDMAQSFFGRYFKVENGQAIGYDNSGNKIFSTSRPGEVADFDEALEVLVRAYSGKDSILRGSGASGSGATVGNSSTAGKRTMSRAAWQALPPTEQAAAVRTHAITD